MNLAPLAPLGRGVGGELGWNALSFVVMALSSAGAFFIVGRWHGQGALGVFSQAYAVYVVASQLVVLGVQFSVLRAAAAMPMMDAEMRPMLWGALWLVLGAGMGALALGLHRWASLRHVIMPQAMILALRPLGNELIVMIKASAVASLVTLFDLMGATRLAFARSFDLSIYLYAALIYLVMVEIIRRVWDRLELRLTRHMALR